MSKKVTMSMKQFYQLEKNEISIDEIVKVNKNKTKIELDILDHYNGVVVKRIITIGTLALTLYDPLNIKNILSLSIMANALNDSLPIIKNKKYERLIQIAANYCIGFGILNFSGEIFNFISTTFGEASSEIISYMAKNIDRV